jgi:hypothetical protein
LAVEIENPATNRQPQAIEKKKKKKKRLSYSFVVGTYPNY